MNLQKQCYTSNIVCQAAQLREVKRYLATKNSEILKHQSIDSSYISSIDPLFVNDVEAYLKKYISIGYSDEHRIMPYAFARDLLIDVINNENPTIFKYLSLKYRLIEGASWATVEIALNKNKKPVEAVCYFNSVFK